MYLQSCLHELTLCRKLRVLEPHGQRATRLLGDCFNAGIAAQVLAVQAAAKVQLASLHALELHNVPLKLTAAEKAGLLNVVDVQGEGKASCEFDKVAGGWQRQRAASTLCAR